MYTAFLFYTNVLKKKKKIQIQVRPSKPYKDEGGVNKNIHDMLKEWISKIVWPIFDWTSVFLHPFWHYELKALAVPLPTQIERNHVALLTFLGSVRSEQRANKHHRFLCSLHSWNCGPTNHWLAGGRVFEEASRRGRMCVVGWRPFLG